MSFSALVLGLVLLARARPATVVNAQGTAAAGPLSSPAETKTDSPGPRTTIDIDVRHLGNLKLEIKAAVTNERSRLTRAKVVAYADMKEMPLAHLQGPLPMREARGRPGVYTARAGVPMVGDYEIRVEVRSPIRADETKLISVGVVGSVND